MMGLPRHNKTAFIESNLDKPSRCSFHEVKFQVAFKFP